MVCWVSPPWVVAPEIPDLEQEDSNLPKHKPGSNACQLLRALCTCPSGIGLRSSRAHPSSEGKGDLHIQSVSCKADEVLWNWFVLDLYFCCRIGKVKWRTVSQHIDLSREQIKNLFSPMVCSCHDGWYALRIPSPPPGSVLLEWISPGAFFRWLKTTELSCTIKC